MIAIIVLGAVTIAQVIAIQQLQKQHARERQDLLDRIMSKSFEEYKELTEETPKASEPVDLSEEEEWAREVEMMRETR